MKKFFNSIRNKVNAIAISAKAAFESKKGEGYIDTGVKIIIGVVVGGVILAGLYALFSTVIFQIAIVTAMKTATVTVTIPQCTEKILRNSYSETARSAMSAIIVLFSAMPAALAIRIGRMKKMNKIIRVLGRKGNTTIPFAIRMKTGFKPQDVISFEVKDRDTLIIHKEKICDRCNGNRTKPKEASLLDVINSLPCRMLSKSLEISPKYMGISTTTAVTERSVNVT